MLKKSTTWPEAEKAEYRQGMQMTCMSPEESEEEENSSDSDEEQPQKKVLKIFGTQLIKALLSTSKFPLLITLIAHVRLFFPASPLSSSNRNRQLGLSREQQARPTVTRPSASNAFQRENTERPVAAAMVNTHHTHTVDTGTHIAKLQSDVAAMKQTLSAMSEVQDEIVCWVKKN
ncbi:Hypothetical predicted protein [Paramuricea clavata]|uniref:Uncharacterized protein n=1 Tax=Paramuricea clavata TaxID=317549 RepID=A0A6S7FWG0_PARCT|nr:Hypothetical predicted protein [Paramuricea clavata]